MSGTMNTNTQVHHERPSTRREFLTRGGCGFGGIALASMLSQQSRADVAGAKRLASPLSPKTTHHKPRAKNVIFVFIEGGPSHMDLFDPKPQLRKLAGQKLPASFKRPLTAMGESESPLLADKRKWKQHGKSGIWVSDWLPNISTIVDDIAVLRSCQQDGLNHVGSVCQMNTGSVLGGRPSLGSWVSYGLGSENQNLPSFVVLLDKGDYVTGGSRNWATGFMPSTYQGTLFKSSGEPIANLHKPNISDARQAAKLKYLNSLNRKHFEKRSEYSDLDARIRAYELAFRMQATAPEAIDFKQESKRTLDMYGVDQKGTTNMGRQCLLARRLVERGVRFVQIYSGAGSKWDAHSNIENNHAGMCKSMDQPVAALVNDLKQRGMMEDTLVVWGGEFGRTPMSEKGNGRDHNPWGFTMWFAGGGVKPGTMVGKTDDLGLYAIEDHAHVHDMHATILHMLGMDHTRMTYTHNGKPERATVNEGDVIEKLLL